MAHGEYINAGYIKHPAAGTAGAFGSDATPVDSGMSIVIDSNISWLARESQRVLVSSRGPGSVTRFATAAAMFDGFSTGSSGGASTGTTIPWDRRTAVRFGPFPMLCDAYNTASGESFPRPVSFLVSITSTLTGGSLTMHYAMTTSPDARRLSAGEYVAYSSNATVTGNDTETLTPSARAPRSDAVPWPCRLNPSAASQQVGVIPMWLWVGWACVGSGGAVSIDSVSAWESV
jgi:hypothetical protein